MRMIIATIALVATLYGSDSALAKDISKVVVWKHPQCGCCGKWVEHMRGAGFTVEVNDEENMSIVKRKAGIPESLASCHTAIIDGYRIEGHVPAHVVKRLLETRPTIRGLAVPGMPLGSPGMEVDSGEVEPYKVRAFKDDGSSVVFSRHP